MTRRYGPISTNVWDSEKFLSLEDDSHRLGYLYLIACPHGNSVGVFRLPISYFAADRRKTREEAEAMLSDMEQVGLIERGEDETIRMCSWFYQDTGASNPSTASAFCKVFKDTRLVRRGALRLHAIVEMVFATLFKAETWNPDTKPFGQMVSDVQGLLAAEMKRDPEMMIHALRCQPEPEPGSVLHTVLDTVFNMVSGHGVEQLYHIELVKRETDTDTDTETTSDTDTTSETLGGAPKIARPAQSAPPSPPADGSRSGRGKRVDPQTQAIIQSLAEKAKGQK